MPQSLKRTWTALALAALAVLLVTAVTVRDLVKNLYVSCPSAIDLKPLDEEQLATLAPVFLDASDPASADAAVQTPGDFFRVRFDTKVSSRSAYGTVTEYSNVRIVLGEIGADGKPCTCGEVPIFLSGENPYDLRLYRAAGTDTYVVKGRTSGANDYRGDIRVSFQVKHAAATYLQRDRIFSMRELPLVVSLVALGALVVALFRSRRAMAYAQRMHAWTEARLTPGGLIEGDNGGTLGTLEQSRTSARTRIPVGPILVASSALSTAGLYRDVPIVARENVVEGDHARWSSGTLLRLRDARVLAVLSTLCTALALGARFVA